jgi:NAD-dependent DNA ligase
MLALSGCKICVEGLLSAEKKIIEKVGGEFVDTLTKSTTCLIVKKVGTRAHQEAKKLALPCVELQWLLDCKSASSKVSFDSYIVRPFIGLTISLTGYAPEERFQFQKLVEENGGTFSASLVREKCTHLISESATGDKYFHAKSWGTVHVVNSKWLSECVNRKCKLHNLISSTSKKHLFNPHNNFIILVCRS